MPFAVAFLTVALAGSLISARTLCGYNQISLVWKIVIFFLLFACWLMPAFMMAMRGQEWLPPEIFNRLSTACYFLFGFVFILLMLLLLRDLLWGAAYGVSCLVGKSSSSWSPLNVSVLTKANLATLAATFLVSLYALYAGVKTPAVREMEIRTPKVDREITLLQINDMHIDRTKPVRRFAAIVDKANSLQADVVVLPGDIVDDRLDAILPHLNELQRLKGKYGVYYSAGNHEFYNGMIPIHVYMLKMGIMALSGSGVNVEGLPLYIAGIPDTPAMRKKAGFPNVLVGAKPDAYKILMSHNPTLAREYLARGFDLQLSAHTHGGQIFPFHIPVKIVNNYLAGMYDLPEGKLYISRGAGYWGPPLRLLAPSDMTLIRLLPEEGAAAEEQGEEDSAAKE